MALTLLVGGARSGKSSLAVDIGHRHHAAGMAVSYLATATALDADMEDRITRHRKERPDAWGTVEEPIELTTAMSDVRGLLIVDCLTLWVSNLMWRGDEDDAIRTLAERAAQTAAERDDPTVAITNEVGLGVHPDTELGRRYRDLLGWVNQTWAAAASTSLLLVAGRALPLGDPWELLETPARIDSA